MIELWVERASDLTSSAHQWVRERVADVLGGGPDDVPLQIDHDGALFLRGIDRQLNLSHHRGWLALALSMGEPVGVDVLTVPEHADFVADTALVLSPAEIAFVRSVPPEQRGAAFAECWVRKEAYAKMRRTGLSAELPGLTFSPAPAGPPQVAFWTARIEDVVVSVATTGAQAPEVRVRSSGVVATGLPSRSRMADPTSTPRSLRRDGTALAFVEAGAGEPPFVFVHGWTCNHSHFAPQAAHFAREHRVVSVDLRGHGASDAPEQQYTVSAFADDVAWLCEQLELDHPVLVGHSMGGTVVLEVAARHPELPSAVVMVDAAPIAAMSAAAETAAALVDVFNGPDGPAARAALIDQTTSALAHDPELHARVRRDMASVPDHVAFSCITSLGEWDGEAAARACRVPALHIGAEDPINDAAALRALNPLFRTGQTVGAGHFNQLEVPDQVNAMIERFLVVSSSR